MYPSSIVANRLLALAAASNRTLTPMQLLKLAFLCHGWMLGLYGRPLISDRVEAWKYGPVIPRLYHAVKHYRGGPISSALRAPRQSLSEQAEHVINDVFEIYGEWSGPALSHLTHERDSPWDQVYEDDRFGLPISNRVIKRFYEQQAG